MKIYRFLGLLLVSLFCLTTFSCAASAPNFTLESLSGKKLALTDFRGKVVIMDFWASWCGPCRMAMPELKKLYEKYHTKGLEVLSLNQGESKNEAERFMKSENYPFTVLLDYKGEVGRMYKVSGIPAFFLLDKQGNVVMKEVGFDYGMADKLSPQIEKLLNAK